MQNIVTPSKKSVSIFLNDIEIGAVSEIEFSDEKRCEHIFSYGETIADIITDTETHSVYLSRLITNENCGDIFCEDDFTLSVALGNETVRFVNCRWVKCARKIGAAGNIIENAVITAKSKEVF